MYQDQFLTMPKKVFDVATLRSSVVVGTRPHIRKNSGVLQQTRNTQILGSQRINVLKKILIRVSCHLAITKVGDFMMDTHKNSVKRSRLSPDCTRSEYAPGFDRLSANKTNYELSNTETIYNSQNHARNTKSKIST